MCPKLRLSLLFTSKCDHLCTHRWSLSLIKGCLRVLKLTRVWESLWMSKSGTSGWNGVLILVATESHIPAMPVRFRNSHFYRKTTHMKNILIKATWSFSTVFQTASPRTKLKISKKKAQNVLNKTGISLTKICYWLRETADLFYCDFDLLQLRFSAQYWPWDVQSNKPHAVWPLHIRTHIARESH